jgi:hypothetical protein
VTPISADAIGFQIESQKPSELEQKTEEPMSGL